MTTAPPLLWHSVAKAAKRLGIPSGTLRKQLERHTEKTRSGPVARVGDIVGQTLASGWRVAFGDVFTRARHTYRVGEAAYILGMSTNALRKMLTRNEVNDLRKNCGIIATKGAGKRWKIRFLGRWLSPDGTPGKP